MLRNIEIKSLVLIKNTDPVIRPLSFSQKAVRRQRLSRDDFRDGDRRNLAQSAHRNCKAIGSREGLRDPAEALDRRKVNRLVEPLSQARQGLGKSEPNRCGISPFCFDPAHATKALQSFLNFRIGLLVSTTPKGLNAMTAAIPGSQAMLGRSSDCWALAGPRYRHVSKTLDHRLLSGDSR